MRIHRPRGEKRLQKSREVLAGPEDEDVSFVQLEELFQLDLATQLQETENHLRVMAKGRHEPFLDLSRKVAGAAILDQVFSQRVFTPELQAQADAALRASVLPEEIRAGLLKPGLDLNLLQYLACVSQRYPELRSSLGITDKVFEEWAVRFSNRTDQLSDESRPYALAHVAMLRPDRLAECQVLSLQQNTWDHKERMLATYNEKSIIALTGTRLLQPERSLDETDKTRLLKGFSRRGSFGRSLGQYGRVAILLAPKVEINGQGQIILGKLAKPTGAVRPLPERLL